MNSYRSKLIKKEEIAKGTMAFHFEKPDGFSFVPGQYADLTMVNPKETDEEGNIRTFTIASAPLEKDLIFATRMRDTAFKRELGKMPEGAEIEIDGPFGSFTLHTKREKPAAFIAGGIGITPFLSILKTAAEEKPDRKFYLFYSNRTEDDAPFLRDLSSLTKGTPGFTFVPTMSNLPPGENGWKGETGYINGDMIKKHLPTIDGPIYYLAGPPQMVAAMRKMLSEMGVSEDDIRFEEFSGY